MTKNEQIEALREGLREGISLVVEFRVSSYRCILGSVVCLLGIMSCLASGGELLSSHDTQSQVIIP